MTDKKSDIVAVADKKAKQLARAQKREEAKQAFINVLLWRPANETAVIKKAIENPDITIDQVMEELREGFSSTILMVPAAHIGDKDEKLQQTKVIHGLVANYAANLATFTALTGGAGFLPGLLISIPLTGGTVWIKAKYYDSVICSPGYRKKITQKIAKGRSENAKKMAAKMRQMIG